MKLLIICLFVSLLSVAHGRAAGERLECPVIMGEAGISPSFAPMVAHAIHSLTVEDIQYYFDETATEDNGIPTVNMDLTAEQRILPNAPLAHYDTDFSSVALRTFDFVLRHMNQARWGTSNSHTLEQVTHALHMADIWEHTGEQYRVVERLLAPASDICTCVTDIEENDVLNFLNLFSFKIRYPGITSGNKTLTDRYFDSATRSKRSAPAGFTWGADYSAHYGEIEKDNYKRQGMRPDFDAVDFDLSDAELLPIVASTLQDGDDPSMAPLDSAESWEDWKEMVKTAFEETGYYDLAVFMFCMLNN